MTESTVASINPGATSTEVKPELLRLLDRLPQPKQFEVLDFVRFLHQRQTRENRSSEMATRPTIELHLAPATSLLALTNMVQLGGDAVTDVESLYDNGDH
ncbi:MAG: hypothetical protein AUK03_05905 [Anaerolineae bacterium CG2_30_64_16]|nr:MAG: hypothetical protein AUK03_05905 [Anaerolineae bacterium CG2_30_64_16]